MDAYGVYVKVLSAFLMYFVGRIYYESTYNISSNQNLQIDAICTFSMTIRSGAEQTTVSVDTAEHKPEIMGLHRLKADIYHLLMRMICGVETNWKKK